MGLPAKLPERLPEREASDILQADLEPEPLDKDVFYQCSTCMLVSSQQAQQQAAAF